MRQKALIVMIGMAVAGLNACAYFDVPQGQKTPTEQQKSIAVGPAPEGLSTEYADLIRQKSEGSVELFPFDPQPSAPLSSASQSPQQANDVQSSLVGSRSVDIYNIDDAAELSPDQENVATDSHSVVMSDDGEVTTILFKHGVTKVTAADRKSLLAAAQSFSPDGKSVISVEGHASPRAEAGNPVQREIDNLKVSLDRAYAVTSVLIKGGIPPENIITKGYGAAKNSSNESTAADTESTSRRVDIHGLSQR